MQRVLLESLKAYSERDLTLMFLLPLIEVIHQGRIEYTHSSIEAGRDIVSFGHDYLGREHILCVQVKAVKISYGASFSQVVQTSELAKKSGVTLENGEKCFPHEVWFLTSHPFPEQERRQVADVIAELDRKGIKFIAGEELCHLLLKHVPDLVTPLTKAGKPGVANIIARLCAHSEGRAFGFSHDRTLDQFYVTATMSLGGEGALEAINTGVELSDVEIAVGGLAKKFVEGALPRGIGPQEIARRIADGAVRKSRHWKFIEDHGIPFELTLGVPPERLRTTFRKNAYVSLRYRLRLSKAVVSLVGSAKAALKHCPKELEKAGVIRSRLLDSSQC